MYPFLGINSLIYKYLTSGSRAMIFSLVPLNSKMVYRPSFERYAVSVIVDGFRFEDKGKKKKR